MCWTGLLPSRKQRLFIPVEATEESACLCLLLATLISHWVHFTWARNNFCLLLVLPAPFLRRLSVLGVPRLALTPFRQCSPSPLERSVRSLPQVSAPRAGPSHPVILVSLKHRGGVSVPPSGPSLAWVSPFFSGSCRTLPRAPSKSLSWDHLGASTLHRAEEIRGISHGGSDSVPEPTFRSHPGPRTSGRWE